MSAPLRKSLFERQRAEAQAKRQREKEETAAVYEDFVKSFEDDGGARSTPSRNAYGAGGSGGRYGKASGSGKSSSSSLHALSLSAPHISGPSKRHFTSKGLSRQGVFPALASKKSGNERESRGGSSLKGMFAFEKSFGGDDEQLPPAKKAFVAPDTDEDESSALDREAEKAAAKPTLRLSSLPPGTSPAAVKALIPPNVTVDNVKIIPPSSHGSAVPTAPGGHRKLWSAIVTVAHDTAATELDAVVSLLQNRYLGWGHYLSISRHLSSAALNSITSMSSGLSSSNAANPFGARQIRPRGGPGGRIGSSRRHSRGYAPPPSYESGSGGRYRPTLEVVVSTPSDLKQLKLIHKTIENVLLHGPDFEALLMSRPEVQRDEKWAWIWDSRSIGGVYYRWKLWDILTGTATPRRRHRHSHVPPAPISLFTVGPVWLTPKNLPRFEYITRLQEFASDEDYDSSEDEDEEDEEERRQKDGSGNGSLAGGAGGGNVDGTGALNPLQKAKLTYLLVRLPTTHAKLRKGDIASVTSFAISHASRGAEEVVELVVANISRPFAFTGANPDYRRDNEDGRLHAKSLGENDGDNAEKDAGNPRVDDSAARLVGLYIVSDILSTSSTSGVRHAWRYRQLFESAFKAYKTFEGLGRLEKELAWGRLKSDKWRRSILNILNLWEGWCVFPQASHDHFVQVFEKPPLTAAEEEAAAAAAAAAKAAEEKEAKNGANSAEERKSKSRWRTVDEESAVANQLGTVDTPAVTDKMDVDTDGVGMDKDIDGEPMTDGYDSIDGWPMEDSSDDDFDGEPMQVDEESGENNDDFLAEKNQPQQLPTSTLTQPQQQKQPPMPPSSQPVALKDSSVTSSFKFSTGRPRARPRPKASDMFADSGSE
ncbi:hypothetical protein KEM54_000786 [Ascosphaera aggregata]|nr:hypothetical protein KEM54_000786 [Ascosphaera aggregata]